MENFNCDPNKRRFFRELQSIVNRHTLLFCDVNALPTSTYTYISQNQSGAGSWLDYILSSKKQQVCQVKILYGETLL